MIMGQTGKDSILFRGNIVYDGDASEATFLHELYIKHNPKQRYPIVCDSDFSIKCMRGDTLFIEHFDTRYPYCFQVVEFIANDTLPQNIHIWRYPKSCNNWYYHQKYKTTNLSIKDTIRKSELVGTYKCRWELENSDCLVTSDATMKLNADGTFELIDEWVSWDISGTVFHTGNWEIKQNTVICKVVPELIPSTIQERYPGQVLHFVWTNLEDDRQEIMKEDKELKEHIYHPPVFSGIVDGWIGYESAEVAKSKDTEKFNHLILSKGFKKMVADQPKLALEDEDGEKMSIVDLASSNVVYSQIDYLSKIDRKQLKEYYNLKPRDLKNKKFLNSIFSKVKEEMLKGIKNKSFKFDDVVIDFRKRGFFFRKKVHKDGVTISHQDLERSLSKTLQNITQDYPKTKSLLQKGILKMADEKGLDATTFCMTKKDKSLFSKLFTGKSKAKKDKRKVEKKKNFNRQTAQDFTNFFGTTSTKLLEDKKKENNPFLYHLTK